jgi:hypothetical protein
VPLGRTTNPRTVAHLFLFFPHQAFCSSWSADSANFEKICRCQTYPVGVLGFVTTGCFIRWVEKNSEQMDIIPWKNECYNKEELIGGAIDQVTSTTITLNLNGRGHRLEVLNSNQEITIDQL